MLFPLFAQFYIFIHGLQEAFKALMYTNRHEQFLERDKSPI